MGEPGRSPVEATHVARRPVVPARLRRWLRWSGCPGQLAFVVAAVLALVSTGCATASTDDELATEVEQLEPDPVVDERAEPEPAPEPDPEPDPDHEPGPDPDPEPGPDPDPEPEPEEPGPERQLPDLPGPTDELTLELVTTIGGDISPKSVVASDTGLFVAQNMMYRHTVTVYDREHQLVATIPDTVTLTEFGLDGPAEPLRGSPVEAAFAPDGRHVYVSNYKMYGPGFERGGTDTCSPADGYDDSFVYRIDTQALGIDQVIPVGSVPKYLAVTPDGATVLVSNWCSYDLSVLDTASGTEVERIDIGRYPRGIVVDQASTTAWIAVMGSTDIAVLDLATRELDWLRGVGRSPRHLVLDPDERYLYATLNGDGVVTRIDLETGDTTRVATGAAPRSMDIAADGRSLYVVNYNANTVSKVRTSDMQVLQTIPVDDKPIGITYDDGTGEVWVAHYSGTIRVFVDR